MLISFMIYKSFSIVLYYSSSYIYFSVILSKLPIEFPFRSHLTLYLYLNILSRNTTKVKLFERTIQYSNLEGREGRSESGRSWVPRSGDRTRWAQVSIDFNDEFQKEVELIETYTDLTTTPEHVLGKQIGLRPEGRQIRARHGRRRPRALPRPYPRAWPLTGMKRTTLFGDSTGRLQRRSSLS